MSSLLKLPESFFDRYSVDVARDLIGKILVFQGFKCIITETEAYRGYDDEASHAFRGPTPRTLVMFGPPGYSYVYLIYGMYYCLNIVTEEKGRASGVLIRGVKLPEIHLDGPGKVCRYLGITKQHHGMHLISSDFFYVAEGIKDLPCDTTPRIGIKKATDKLWRFVVRKDVII